jgi:hypothetical protein
MLELLEFLQQHPTIAKQYEQFLKDRQTEVSTLIQQAEGRSHRTGQSPVIFAVDIETVDSSIKNTLESKMDVLKAGQTPEPPAKGKKLAVVDAFKFLLANPLAMNTVYQEFFSQVSRDGTRGLGVAHDDGCWVLKSHINVYRNSKGALKKNVQIHYFAKPFAGPQMAWFLEHKEIPEKNLYPNCDNERCVNPDHHNVGRKGKLKKRVIFRRDLNQAQTRENMEMIVEYLGIDPERGATGTELQARFIAKDPNMTVEQYAEALKLGQAEGKFHFRTTVGRLYLNGYPSLTKIDAATKALDRAGFSVASRI